MTRADQNSKEPLVLYDVELMRVDATKHTLTFRHGTCALVLRARGISTWPYRSVGRLTLHPSGEVDYLIYADPRLRRAAEFDQPDSQLWGWRLEDYHFCVQSGVIPGVNGAVIPRDIEPLQISIPREFIELCARFEITPEVALRAFIADVCGLQSFFMQPREDGYRSLGSDERRCAKAYWLRAHAHIDQGDRS
jgi:hypothetical protein